MSKVIVRVRAVVTKDVVCEGGTVEEMSADPWSFAEDEREVEQTDWEILDVREDE